MSKTNEEKFFELLKNYDRSELKAIDFFNKIVDIFHEPIQNVQSISFPRLVIQVDLAGDNSLAGALCQEFIQRDYMRHIGLLEPAEIVFSIKRVHSQVNLYKEINQVRDIFKIPEDKITIFMQ